MGFVGINCSANTLDRPKFQLHDYGLFIVMVFVSVVIGLHHGYKGRKQSVNEYLIGNRKMKVIPIAFSLTASLVSGVSMVAVPAEIYKFGATLIILPFLTQLVVFFNCQYVLPVLYNLKITSIYEYLEFRFDRRIKLIASFLYALHMVPFLASMIYVPALAIAQGTGLNVHYFTISMSLICIFYTTIGGFKAVIFTDTLQFLFMIGTIIGITWMGISHSGGFRQVYEANYQSGRLKIDFDVDPTKRDTFWTVAIGMLCFWTQNITTNQTCMQKSFSLPTVNRMKIAVTFFGLALFVIMEASIVFGLIIYEQFKDCDPVSSGQIRRYDEISTFYILTVTKDLPGIAGLFISGIYSGSLSSLSASINSLSCTIYKDFISPNLSESSKKRATVLIKVLALTIGLVGTAMVFLMEILGNVFASIIGMGAVAAGPMLGLFILGLFTIRTNPKGAFYGVVASLLVVTWIFVGAQYYQIKKWMHFPLKDLSIDGCNCTMDYEETFVIQDDHEWKPWYIYRISFAYYTMIGTAITIAVAMAISYSEKDEHPLPRKEHLSPLVHWMLPEVDHDGYFPVNLDERVPSSNTTT